MSNLHFSDLETEVKQYFGNLEGEELAQQMLGLSNCLDIPLKSDHGITEAQYELGCQILQVLHSQGAKDYTEAHALITSGALQVAPQSDINSILDRQAAQIAAEIPLQVAVAKGDIQQGITKALGMKVAEKVGAMDIDAEVEALMQEGPKKPTISVLDSLGLAPGKTPKQLTGS